MSDLPEVGGGRAKKHSSKKQQQPQPPAVDLYDALYPAAPTAASIVPKKSALSAPKPQAPPPPVPAITTFAGSIPKPSSSKKKSSKSREEDVYGAGAPVAPDLHPHTSRKSAKEAADEAARITAEKLESVIVRQQHELETLKAKIRYDEVAINKLNAKVEESRRREKAAIEGQTDFQTKRITKELERLHKLVDAQQRDLQNKDYELRVTMDRWAAKEEELRQRESGLAVAGEDELEGQAQELAEVRQENTVLHEQLRIAMEDKAILEQQLTDLQAEITDYKARLMGWTPGGGGGSGDGNGDGDGDEDDADFLAARVLPYEVAHYSAPVIQVVDDRRRRVEQYDVPYDFYAHEGNGNNEPHDDGGESHDDADESEQAATMSMPKPPPTPKSFKAKNKKKRTGTPPSPPPPPPPSPASASSSSDSDIPDVHSGRSGAASGSRGGRSATASTLVLTPAPASAQPAPAQEDPSSSEDATPPQQPRTVRLSKASGSGSIPVQPETADSGSSDVDTTNAAGTAGTATSSTSSQEVRRVVLKSGGGKGASSSSTGASSSATPSTPKSPTGSSRTPNADSEAAIREEIGRMTITQVKKMKVGTLSAYMKVLGLKYITPKQDAAQKLFDAVHGSA